MSQCFPSTDRSCISECRAAPIFKINIVYDEPFWRADGLSGQSAAPGRLRRSPSTRAPTRGTPGVLCVIIEGPDRAAVVRARRGERRRRILDRARRAVRRRRPASPVDYIEQNWTIERYSGGGMISHAPPGVLTEFGPALREPCGRIHWAGTESSAVMCGWVDGAVRSGERAAAEVMAARTGRGGVTVSAVPAPHHRLHDNRNSLNPTSKHTIDMVSWLGRPLRSCHRARLVWRPEVHEL